MDLKLNERVVVVTGGSGGIGSAICKAAAAEGARVVVGYHRNAQSAQAVSQDIKAEGGSAVPMKVDVRNLASIREFFRASENVFGGLDVLVNCAGSAHFSPLISYAEAAWNNVIDTNLKGTFFCIQEVVPFFLERGGGDIVNISSLAATTGSFEGGPYAASKAGVNILTLSLALELASHNIRVNAIAPGRIDTPFRRTRSGPYFDFMLNQTPQKRLGTTAEVANAVIFAASRVSEFITGETIYVSGGLNSVYLNHVTPDPDSKLRG